MAHTITNRLRNESDATWTIHVFLRSDGVTGELTDQRLLSSTELTPSLPAGAVLSVQEIWYSLTNFTVQVGWKTSGATLGAITLTSGSDNHMDFTRFAGVMDMSAGTSSGQLVISTVGFTTTAAFGHIIIRGHKHPGNALAFPTVGA
jgi:hypothetical protein